MNCAVRNKSPKDPNTGAVAEFVRVKCEDEATQQRRNELQAVLLAEELGHIPDTLDMAAFERFVLKYALHFMRAVSPADRDVILNSNPWLIIPEDFALRVKDEILQKIPPRYVSFVEIRTHHGIFPRGKYQFKRAVPAPVLHTAMRNAGLVKNAAPV
jgi:hypothetical protein